MRPKDRGLHRLARELSSGTFLTRGGIGISYPSSHVERPLLRPKEWMPLLHERLREDTQTEMAKLARGESSAGSREDILFNIENKWGRGRSTIFAITASSSAAK